MKKVLFLMMMMVVGMATTMKAQSWSTEGPELANQINMLGEYLSETFRSQGIPATGSAKYSASNKSVDIIIDFGTLDIIPYVDENILKEMKVDFVDSFIDAMRSDPNGLNEVREMADLMAKDGGTLRIVLKGAGKQKAATITAQDLKRAL